MFAPATWRLGTHRWAIFSEVRGTREMCAITTPSCWQRTSSSLQRSTGTPELAPICRPARPPPCRAPDGGWRRRVSGWLREGPANLSRSRLRSPSPFLPPETLPHFLGGYISSVHHTLAPWPSVAVRCRPDRWQYLSSSVLLCCSCCQSSRHSRFIARLGEFCQLKSCTCAMVDRVSTREADSLALRLSTLNLICCENSSHIPSVS